MSVNHQTAEAPVARERSHRNLRSRLAEHFERPQSKQLDWMELVIRYLARVQRREGDSIVRSVPQIARGLGLPVEGLSTRQIRDRWENQITNTLRYLEDAGYVQSVERDVRRANGEGIGIVVVLPAGVAQSVRATPRRSSLPDRRDFSTEQFAPPQREPIRRACDVPLSSSDEGENAAARGSALGTRDRALRRSPVRSALERTLTTIGSESSGAAVLAACPELASEPLEVVARSVWSLAGCGDGRLSQRGAERLSRAAVQLERTGYCGASGAAAPRAALFDLALGDWADYWTVRTGSPAPATVGGLAECLRKVAHREVRAARQRGHRRG